MTLEDFTEVVQSLSGNMLQDESSSLLPKLLEDTYFFGSINLGKELSLKHLIDLQNLESGSYEIWQDGNYYHVFYLGEAVRTFFYNPITGEFRIVEVNGWKSIK